ncbi:MATE family efflux transporter [Brevibacterium daeguense]|uniref:MATE family efflux transporter n=1 Tax=Brevibacterium daeguense TaxID=909936 RepID=A0ABP8EMM3_9MICO|nr:MATE family efflux transporter [Brevibacterium daeguense]
MRALDRDILGLAVPALGALAAEPLFLLADTAMVGHLGPSALGALAIASTILQTVLGLMIFLAYATTPRVARRLGAGDQAGAISAGFDGIWLALITSAVLLVVGLPFIDTAVGWFNPTAEVAAGAVGYLTISWWGLPFMLTVIAATGLLRGLQDTRTPLYVATGGFLANIGLNALFIYGLEMGVAGSALGTLIAHVAMCSIYLVIAVRAARRFGAGLRPDWRGVLSSARTSGWLLLRNGSLRAAMIILVVLATGLGTVQLAAIQVIQTLFNALALVLDSLAIAGQALIGLELGLRRRDRVAAINRRLIQWGIGFGIVVGALLALVSPVLGRVFTQNSEVAGLITGLALILAVGMPLAGYVFTLDGVLMGAEDSRYLAVAQFGALLAYCLLLAVVFRTWPNVHVLWACFGIGFVAWRAIGLGWRVRNDKWIIRAEQRT